MITSWQLLAVYRTWRKSSFLTLISSMFFTKPFIASPPVDEFEIVIVFVMALFPAKLLSFPPIYPDGIIHTPLKNIIGEFRRDQAGCRRVRVAPGKRAGIGEIR